MRSASPSMDIQVSSNFERLLFEAGGRDAASVRRLMEQLKQSGRFVLPDATLAAIRAEFDAGRADETGNQRCDPCRVARGRRPRRSPYRGGAGGWPIATPAASTISQYRVVDCARRRSFPMPWKLPAVSVRNCRPA